MRQWHKAGILCAMSALFSIFVLAAKVATAAPLADSAPTTPAPSAANDICLAMIPPKLEIALKRADSTSGPDYVLPKLTDAPVNRLLAIAEAGEWPCPFVVAADFDGDDRLDRALILKHKESTSVRLIAVRNLITGWQIDLQEDWSLTINQVGIEPLEPGLYEQARSGNAAAELDNLKSIQSDHAGFTTGPIGKSSRAFFFVENEWRSISLDESSDDK
jgi:hypothetical protein